MSLNPPRGAGSYTGLPAVVASIGRLIFGGSTFFRGLGHRPGPADYRAVQANIAAGGTGQFWLNPIPQSPPPPPPPRPPPGSTPDTGQLGLIGGTPEAGIPVTLTPDAPLIYSQFPGPRRRYSRRKKRRQQRAGFATPGRAAASAERAARVAELERPGAGELQRLLRKVPTEFERLMRGPDFVPQGGASVEPAPRGGLLVTPAQLLLGALFYSPEAGRGSELYRPGQQKGPRRRFRPTRTEPRRPPIGTTPTPEPRPKLPAAPPRPLVTVPRPNPLPQPRAQPVPQAPRQPLPAPRAAPVPRVRPFRLPRGFLLPYVMPLLSPLTGPSGSRITIPRSPPLPRPGERPTSQQPGRSPTRLLTPLTGLQARPLPSPAPQRNNCDCTKPTRKERKRGCTNPVVKRERQGEFIVTTRRIKCPSSRKK